MQDKTTYRLAVLYADVSGSTKIYEKFGDEAARTDINNCLQLLANTAASHEGRTVKHIGDEIMCIFQDPYKAALAATEMQNALRQAGNEGRFSTGSLRIKIGWHYGGTDKRGDDYVGEAPVTAQQVIKMAKADEILTTSRSLESVSGDINNNTSFIDRVEAEFGNGEIDVYSLHWEEDESEITVIGNNTAEVSDKITDTTLELNYGDTCLRMDKGKTHCRIGRGDDNELVVNGQFTSRHHAEIYYRHGRFHLVDNSTNGTFIIGADLKTQRLRREEVMLSGSGTICFGGEPGVDPAAAVRFQCLE